MIKILVVDDEAIIRDLLKDVLEAKNYTVITADNGTEAVEKIKEKPDLVLLDIKMPGMDGLQTLKKIKEIEPSITVVMVTGLAEEDIAMACIEAGAHDYVTKPIDRKHLDSVIEVFIIQKTLEEPDNEIESSIEKDTQQENEKGNTDEKRDIIDKPSTPKGIEKRKCRRFQIPGASGKVKKTGILAALEGFSKEYPVLNISKGGLDFSCREEFKKNQKIIFQLVIPGGPVLNLRSIIKRVGRPDIDWNRLCGVEFISFGDSPDINPVEALNVLRKLDKKYGG